MNKVLLLVGVALSCCLLCLAILAGSVISTLNSEAGLRQQVLAQYKVNEANFDKMWKIIAQSTQITKASSDLQKELVESLIKGRGDSFIKIVHESNPESGFSREQFTSLNNIVEAQREGFFREQSKLIDIDREHRTKFQYAWSGFVLNFAGRAPLDEVKPITSEQTEEVFTSGKDNEIELGL